MSNVLGVILAGGLARRMGGGDKSLNALGTETVLDRVISRLRPQVEAIALNANGDPARFDRFDLPVLPDSEPEYPGPLAGVLAGMDWAAAQGVDHIVSVAADTPFFPSDLVQKLRQEGDGIVLAAVDDPVRGLLRQPTFGQWPVALGMIFAPICARGCGKSWRGRISTMHVRPCFRCTRSTRSLTSTRRKIWFRQRTC